jgi:hypothetical protein
VAAAFGKHFRKNFRERTLINRPAAEVWPYVINPAYFQQWNEKIASMDVRETFRLGQPFVTHYLWKKKRLQCLSVAVEIEEGRLLELRHSNFVGPGVNPEMEVIERIELEEKGFRCIVTKNVAIKNHGISWVLVPLIWLGTRFGKPVKEDRLKLMGETKA